MNEYTERQVYEDLANAIVVQALKDYAYYKKKIQDTESTRYFHNLKMYNEVCEFLFSDRLEAFTSVPVEVLIEKGVDRVCKENHMQGNLQSKGIKKVSMRLKRN